MKRVLKLFKSIICKLFVLANFWITFFTHVPCFGFNLIDIHTFGNERNKSLIDSIKASHFCFSLSLEEEFVLRDFFLAMLSSAECGYVLYGDKPVCFMGLDVPGTDPVGTLGHRLSVDLNNGIEVWQKLGLPQQTRNFILHIDDYIAEDGSQENYLLLINRNTFYKVVRDNLSLFQYILGPHVTPEKLLEQLLDPTESFFSVLKDDKVLIGILLGFGTNNALHVSRSEIIREALDMASCRSDSENISLEPSFGFSSLAEEYQELNQEIYLSSKFLEKEIPSLYFGCLEETSETTALIKHYEEVQLKVIEVLESDDFLEKVLRKFYDDEQLVLIRNQRPLQKLFNLSAHYELMSLPVDWSRIVAYCIWQEFLAWSADDPEEPHDFAQFIAGMRAAEKNVHALQYTHLDLEWFDLSFEEKDYCKGFRMWAHFKPGGQLYALDSVIQALLDEQQTSALFSNEQKVIYQAIQKLHRYLYQQHQHAENCQAKEQFLRLDPSFSLIKERLYCEPLANGGGRTVHQNDRVKLRYCVKTAQGYVLEDNRESIEEIDLQRAMYGLRKGLEGLKEGAQGILYIHPEYGFRDTWNLPSIKPFLIIEFEIVSIV